MRLTGRSSRLLRSTTALNIDPWQQLGIHTYAVPKIRMSGYVGSVGGDHGDPNQSSDAIQNKSGGSGNIVNITATEIAVIVITITLVFVAVVGVFYCRALQARRDADMKNKARERESTPVTGDSIELVHNKRSSGSSCDTISIKGGTAPGEASSSKDKTPAAMESNQEPKLPLRHYIHWKNPSIKAQTMQTEDGPSSLNPSPSS